MSKNNPIIEFFSACHSPVHAKNFIESQAKAAGYKTIDERVNAKNRRQLFTRDNSIALLNITDKTLHDGIKIVACHLDFPSLRIKPLPMLHKAGMLAISTELYGAPVIGSWFDRELSIAGQFFYSKKGVQSKIVDFKRPIGSLTSPALHLNRTINENRVYDKQNELNVLIGNAAKTELSFAKLLSDELDLGINDSDLLGHELYFYAHQGAAIHGLKNELISAQGIDNLSSCYCQLQVALSKVSENCLFVFFDHEEIGSNTSSAAAGSFLEQVLFSLVDNSFDFHKLLQKSSLLSLDVGHAADFKYLDKFDENHQSKLGEGAVFKQHAGNKYTSSSSLSAKLREGLKAKKIPFQDYVSTNNIVSGSTIGPILSTKYGLQAIDIGIAMLSMHSIRETAALADFKHLTRLIEVFVDG